MKFYKLPNGDVAGFDDSAQTPEGATEIPAEQFAQIATTPQVASGQLAQDLADAIDALVASIYANWSRFQAEYQAREAAAQAFKDGGYVGDPGVWITSYSQSAGVGYQQAADTILTQASALNDALCKLGALRMRKYEILNAPDASTAQTLYTEITVNIKAIAAAIQ